MDDRQDPSYQSWIGRRIRRVDIVSPRLIEHFRATLSPRLAPANVPLGLFWALCPDALPPAELGRDGHPQPGKILPHLPLPRRMWAGGELDLRSAFHQGDEVLRDTTVEAISFKNGSTGQLGFVSVRHDYSVAGRACISERQDLVFREDPVPGERKPICASAPDLGLPLAEFSLCPDPVLLYRYSALTFNGHRIHYDRSYATSVEGYGDLVVHAPLQATLMLNLAAEVLGVCPSRFNYRAVSLLTCGEPIRIEAHSAQNGGIALRVRRDGGPVTMSGMAFP